VPAAPDPTARPRGRKHSGGCNFGCSSRADAGVPP
jgi:hypothetical protein